MHFVAWNGEIWSGPFQPNELVEDGPGGLRTREGCSVAWDADGYRGENWIALKDWTEEKAKAITSNTKPHRPEPATGSQYGGGSGSTPGGQNEGR